ncbi:MAG: transglycosylase domain-containing protein [Actinomycetes bacterium]
MADDTPSAPTKKAARRAAAASAPRRTRTARRLAFVGLVVGLVGLGGVWMALNTIELPSAAPPRETTFVCDNDTPAGKCTFDNSIAQLSNSEERVVVRYEELPPVLVQAVLAAEDRRYFDHNGIDPAGIARAVFQGLKGSSQSRQGGSTITQQYVKNVFLTSERTYTRKLKEAVLAVKLERELDKREILTRYLNQVYFGRGAYGVEAASRAYFGVGVKNLQLYQAAYLAGLIRSPESGDAAKVPDEATRRRNSVLAGMVAEGFVDGSAADRAREVPWVTDAAGGATVTVLPRPPKRSDFGSIRYPGTGEEFWLEEVRSAVRTKLGPGAETRGLRVYTTFDPKLQQYAVDAMNATLDQPDGPVGALVALDDQGRIRAMVGGRDYATDKVNLALGTAGGGSGRQPGSTFKPIALAAFVEAGYSVKSPFRAPPVTQFPNVYATPGKLWQPKNFEKEDLGVLTVEQATWKSSNTVYAALAKEVTPAKVAEMGTRLGITAPLAPNYSLVLGTGEVSVLDMATAYSTLSNRGVLRTPYMVKRIEDASGRVLFDGEAGRADQQVVAKEVADTVTNVLQGVLSRGTGTGAALRTLAAGKTGTTQDSRDAWFAGYTCRLTTAVWMGFQQPKAMETYKGRKVTGGSFPATIWRDFMNKATKGQGPCKYPAANAGSTILNQSLSAVTTVPGQSTTTTSTSSTVPGSSTTVPAPTTTARPVPTTARPTTTVPPVSTTLAPG